MKSLILLTSLALSTLAQDYVSIDPKHYKVELENKDMRVVRCNYGPREKSGMLAQPRRIAVFLTDFHVRITLRDGTSREVRARAGEARSAEPETHQVENLSDQPFEVIIVENKSAQRQGG